MESSIAVFLMRQPACEQLPTSINTWSAQGLPNSLPPTAYSSPAPPFIRRLWPSPSPPVVVPRAHSLAATAAAQPRACRACRACRAASHSAGSQSIHALLRNAL